MPQPVWRKIIKEMRVPESPGTPWTIVLENPSASKLMKIEVVVDLARNITGTWVPRDYVTACSPDGDFAGTAILDGPQRGNPLMTSAAVGALIARIGGSTADKILTPPTTLPPAPASAPIGSTIGFPVGRTCIFSVPASPIGALFLGVNDTAERMAGVKGCLFVNVYEAL